MGKKKVVLDTNIYVSAIGWNGIPSQIIQKAIDGEFNLYISLNQLIEIRDVLEYPKLKFTKQQKNKFLSQLYSLCQIIIPSKKVDVIREDTDDNAILEPCIDYKIDFVISGDNHLLKINGFNGSKIITPSKFLEEINL